MSIWLPYSWNVSFLAFWIRCWRGIVVCAFFAFITIAGMCNFLWTHSALQQLTPAQGPDAWHLSMQTLHTYADELAQVALSTDAEQQVQSVERVKAMVRNCESEIYRLQHASKAKPEEGVLSLETMQHLFFRAKDEALNLIQLPSHVTNERRAIQALMLTQSVASIHTSLFECLESRRAVRTQAQAVALHSSLNHSGSSLPILLGMLGLTFSACGVVIEWQAAQNRTKHESASDAEFIRDLAVEGPVAMLALDLAGIVRWTNIAGAGLLHSSREAVIGSSFLQLVIEQDRVADFLARMQRGESLTAYSLTLRLHDETVVNVLLDATACLKRGFFTHVRCVLHDVTGRLQVEQAYRSSERRLTAVVNHSPTGVYLADCNGTCTFVNQKWCDLTGMSAERAAGGGWVDALHPDDRDRVVTEWERCAQSGEPFQLEYRYVKPDGTITWIVGRSVALRDEAGQVTQFLGNVTDITKLKQTEQTLVKERLHLRAILESASDGIAVIDEHGAIESVNPSFQRLFGYPDNELIGANISRLMHSSSSEANCISFLQFVSRGESQIGNERCEGTGLRKDGDEFPLELSVSVMQAGSTPHFAVILRDISERKMVEERLRRSEERFELAVRGSNDVVWDWNIQTNEVYCAPRLAEILGFDLSEMQPDRNWLSELIHPEDRERSHAARLAHLDSDIPYSAEHRLRAKSGAYHWFHSRGKAVRDQEGKPIRMVGTASDITEQKRQEAALRQYASDVEEARLLIADQAFELSQQAVMLREANHNVQAASEAKGRFLANMSHEIRTPLNAILGMSEIALDGDLSHEQRELLQIVNFSGRHLLSLINDILDFSKIEAGKLDLEVAPFAIRDCIRQTIEMFKLTAENKGLVVRSQVDDRITVKLMGDEGRLRQILVNLVSNAVKFTSIGEVVVTVQPANSQGSMDSSNLLRFTVRDTGIGIPDEKLDAVFRPFEQADSSTTRRFGGTGLGLSIVANLVQIMGGRVWVESELGHGSQFHFEVQLLDACMSTVATVSERLPDARFASEKNALNVLVAEDNLANQKLVTMILQMQGHRVTVVDDGLAAVAAAKSQSFDVILMDMQMPKLSGMEATRSIRSAEFNTNASPATIIALTADTMYGHEEDCLAAGMDGYLTKPFRREELFIEVRRALSKKRSNLLLNPSC